MEKEFEALEFGKWYPIEEYYKRVDEMDWALVQFKEIKTGFMPLPYRAEYIKRYGVWKTETDADRYLCELCEPVAFMLWQPYEQALTELEQIKESKPSEALKCLERIENNILYLLSDCDVDVETDTNFLSLKEHKSCEKIRNYILKTQELEKVLEVIKEKYVNMDLLTNVDTVEEYNSKVSWSVFRLTEEEFDLLKRGLEK